MSEKKKYRIYTEFHMSGYADLEAESQEEALKEVAEWEHDPENFHIDGWGDCPLGPDFKVYSINGKII